MKPKILIVVDEPGWALERTADNVIMRLQEHYDFKKVFNCDAVKYITHGSFDLLYITYWRQFKDAGIEIQLPDNVISGVRSHFKWDGGCGMPPSPETIACLKQFAAINVPSLILYDIFKGHHESVCHTPHGVDHHVFHPLAKGPISSPSGEITLGWAGSRTNHPGKRGLDELILPALNGLSGISLKTADRESKWRTQEEMVEFYQGLDACICASRTEGGPHPLLEASACGVPVISTQVGIAPELVEHMENGLLIDRTLDAVREAVILLRDNRDLRVEMAVKARETIEENWTWDIQAQKYIPFFNKGLECLS